MLTTGCPLTGYPEVTIEWMFNGNAIETTNNSTKYRLMHNNKVLSISNFNNVSVGDYSCKGTNLAGSADASLKLKITSKFTMELCTFKVIYILLQIVIIIIKKKHYKNNNNNYWLC